METSLCLSIPWKIKTLLRGSLVYQGMRGIKRAFLIRDLPFIPYQASTEEVIMEEELKKTIIKDITQQVVGGKSLS